MSTEKVADIGVQKLQDAFKNALDLPLGTDFSSLTYQKVASWDSVAHMEVISEIEKTFDIMLEPEDIFEMSSFDGALKTLKKYGVELDA